MLVFFNRFIVANILLGYTVIISANSCLVYEVFLKENSLNDQCNQF